MVEFAIGGYEGMVESIDPQGGQVKDFLPEVPEYRAKVDLFWRRQRGGWVQTRMYSRYAK